VSGGIERIVVPLDAAAENRAAIETAARLAARAGATLHGIFIEDEELLHVAALPFTRQLAPGLGAQPFTVEDTELHLRAAAERVRREFLAAARRHGVEPSFEVMRGRSETVLAGISERDLVVAGARSRPVAGHFRVECRWWSSVEIASASPFLLARNEPDGGGPVVMLLRDLSPASARLLAAAARVAEVGDGGLTVICPPALAGAADFNDWLATHLAGRRVRLRVETAPGELEALTHQISEFGCRLVALEAGPAAGEGARLRAFAERFACDVLIVH
jgi:nucleotide-binding universal stress UspA family protein